MSEVAVPLALLFLGMGAMLWEMVRADASRPRDRGTNRPPGAGEPEQGGTDANAT